MKVIDLFAGIGSLSLGFQNAGFEVVAAIDNWEAALSIYQENFNHDALL
ncbi:DNA cytosine methyltransferase [Candidatus Parabeggiatoa sp. HSG14]|nr:DNA cytosine methyltransferase [Thiotrichales bacterium HSG14]